MHVRWLNPGRLAALALVSSGCTLLSLLPTAVQAQDKPLYTVVDGYKVDADTMTGFRTWRAAACDRCHGANQEGMVGPSLISSLKAMSKDEFVKTVRDGRLDKGMQSFGTSKQVMDNIDSLYAYLKGRSDGAITRSKVEPIR
ncbi:c-type cytochrome [Pseudaquabacterium rugosum]|uniref:c-type cytochrome n=1 Tax=Pseudaquabacterium rugosum TaxID=2984194 RepID=UPI003BF9F068